MAYDMNNFKKEESVDWTWLQNWQSFEISNRRKSGRKTNNKHSYRKHIACQLLTQYIKGTSTV